MTDRVSGPGKNPYQVQPSSTEKPEGGRAKAVRTHARHHSRIASDVNIGTGGGEQLRNVSGKVESLVTELSDPASKSVDLARKFTKLCNKFPDMDLKKLIVSRIQRRDPETRQIIEANLGGINTKMSDAAVQLFRDVTIDVGKLPK